MLPKISDIYKTFETKCILLYNINVNFVNYLLRVQ